ncbi:M14 family zinc carboxypeptidase [Leucothrix arctica]|uniref:Peptidase M14 domain-containing protein n=1 Tax=Leucothrix arctica TaxID=1481894 RepID=A0A317CEE2_9GAMM|nr:M14 family zinc carboxypeptidase [Leucothrix arctica]PWQ94492.1 hypothetical protein DKT75_14430 [Leucothrix arctica]
MNRSYPRTLYNLPDDTVEAWLFEPFESRLQVEKAWAARGKNLKLHCAYKSLLHTVLEGQLGKGVNDVVIRYPVIDGDEPQRFRLECYPITGLLDGVVSFEPCKATVTEGELPFYEIVTENVIQRISAPVRWVTSKTQKRQLVACGWVINQQGEGRYLATEFDSIYNDACQYVADLPLLPKNENNGPFFDRLMISIGLPMPDVPLAIGSNAISYIEAMHEDLYFTALEIIEYRLSALNRGKEVLGQIVPEVVFADEPSLLISIEQHSLPSDIENHVSEKVASLNRLEHWLSPLQVLDQLAALSGVRFDAESRQGRPVLGCAVINGAPVKLAISGGQHANESSGVVGALRAAHVLKQRGNVDFTVCPLENPDGYALFQQLCEKNPNHMHHAARYTSTGKDLTCGTSHESLIRGLAKAQLQADVHLNLHGYPAHEWTRPLSGYVPEGFTAWTIPKGFFLICRYHAGFEAQARILLDAAIQAVIGFDAQKQQNIEMLQNFFPIVDGSHFEVAEGVVPYVFSEDNGTDYPIEIITEAPDETVYGEAFMVAHESHYRVVLAVADELAK